MCVTSESLRNVRFRRFTARRLSLAAVVGAAVVGAVATPVAASTTLYHVNVAPDGAPLHTSYSPDMARDGSVIAFVAHDAADVGQVYARFPQSATTRLVSHRAGSTAIPSNGYADTERVSGDGKWIVFVSAATDLGPTDPSAAAVERVYLYSVATDTVQLLPAPSDAVTGTGARMIVGGISNDGNHITYSYRASDLDPTVRGVAVVDRGADLSSMTVTSLGTTQNAGVDGISDDGVWILGTSGAQLRLMDRIDATKSLDPTAGLAGSLNGSASMTPDGRYIVFGFLPAGDNSSHVYLRDVLASAPVRVDPPQLASGGQGASFPGVSPDGRLVAYETDQPLTSGDTTGWDVYLTQPSTGVTARVTDAPDGTSSNAAYEFGDHIAFDGTGDHVVFGTFATNIDPGFSSGCPASADTCMDLYAAPTALPAATSTTADSVGDGGTLSTAPPSSSTPVATMVDLPSGLSGTVSITTTSSVTPASGFDLLGQQVDITAPVATWDSPLALTFGLDPSVIPVGQDATSVEVLRNGVPLANCLGASTALPPDALNPDGSPCISARTTLPDGTITLTVLTPHASEWNFAAGAHDTVAPTIALTTPADNAQFVLGQSVAAAYSCSDSGGSGLATCAGPVASGAALDTSALGAKTFTVTATDDAGNSSTVTHTYRVAYDFTGFLDSVSNAALNVVPAGKGIPLDFSLAGYHGLGVLDGTPTSQPVTCPDSPPNAVSAVSSPSNSLQYIAKLDRYEYQLSTSKSWGGTCRRVTVALADATLHSAVFRFK